VRDGNRPVVGLGASDFELLDNGVLQQIAVVGVGDVPVSAILAIDASGSVQGERLQQLRSAGLRFVSSLRHADEAGLLTFTERVVVRSRPTSDAAALAAALGLATSGLDTALIDAVYAAMLTGADATGRPLVIVFSDGADTASFLTADLVLDAARRVGPVVYAVTTAGLDRGAFLDDLVRLTGGRRLDATFDRLGETFAAILDEARQRYLLSYTPEGVDPEGWHELTVRVPKRSNLEVRARPGYLATP
jgi:Ca-activated chloride channel family protein